MQKVYNRVYWENEPSHNTPLSESNLNKLDYALDVVDTRVVELGGYEERAEESADSANASAIEVRELKRQVQALVAAVNAITANATTLNPGSSATASFDSSTGVLSLGIPRGDSGGITAPVNGMYTMYVDSDGNLWLVTNGEQGSEYWWQYNPTTGELYYRTPGEYVEKTIVGDVIVEITDGVEGFPIKSLVAEITPVQSGSGDPSPTNIRPISGRTGLTVTRCGRNLGKITLNSIADADIGEGSYTVSGLTFSFTKVSDNGVSEIVVNGTPTARATSMLSRNLLADIPPGRYILSGCPSGGAANKYRLTCWDNTANVTLASDVGSGATFELVEGHTVFFAIDISSAMASETINNLVFKPMIRLASDSNDAYEPYNGTSLPISWQTQAGTVYGGTLDVVSGVLTVKGVLHTLTGQENFALATNSRRFQKAFSTLGWERANTLLSTQNQSNSRCSHAIYLTSATATATPADYRITADPNVDYANAIVFYDSQSEFADAAAFNAYLAEQYTNGTPVQLYYDLATPQTYQLTATEIAYIETLNGINILYTDAGSIDEVTYIVESYEED